MNVRWILNVFLALLADSNLSASIPLKNHDAKDYFAVELKNGEGFEKLLKIHPNWSYEHSAEFSDDFHIFSFDKNHSDYHLFKSCESLDDIVNSNEKRLLKREHQELINTLHENNVRGIHVLPKKRLVKRLPIPVEVSSRKEDSSVAELNQIKEEFKINDPLFDNQWHIKNVAFPGEDVNVIPVWRRGITGKGVVTALIDDGLDYESLDLKDNYCPEGSWDYNDNRPNPKPELTNDYHGTRCAAEIAAVKGNEYCGVGVAYDSKVSGIRILSGEITSEEESAAMIYGLDVNHIYSCSWGPPDNGRSMDAPDKMIKTAMLKGIQDGRSGKGALYVFASGNGGNKGDTCNFDGYTNSIYSITVSAIDHKGLHPTYSESCTAVMVSTYSSGSGEHIHTTDIHDTCTDAHGGTSAAAPLAAGIYALVLEANPNLTWRDVQYLTVLSAGEIDPYHESWQASAIPGRRYSPVWGWGKTDAEKMVQMAQENWELLKPQSWYYMPYRTPNLEISSGIGEVEDTFEISEEIVQRANFERVEQLTITVNIKSNRRGDVEIDLISPSGIKSQLAKARRRDDDTNGFKNWTFSSVAHWGEPLPGKWTLKVRNVQDKNTVKFEGWQLRAFGECINPELAKRYDLNEDYSKLNFEDEVEEPSVSSKILDEPTTTEPILDEPTTTESIPEPTATEATAEPTTTEQAEQATTEVGKEANTTEQTTSTTPTTTKSSSSEAAATPSDNSKLSEGNGTYETPASSSPHYFYYFLTLLVIGVLSVGYIIKNRTRPGRARRREDFEFDIIHPDDDESSRFEFDDEYDEDYPERDVDIDLEGEFNQNQEQQSGKVEEFDLGAHELKPEKATHNISDSIILEHDEEDYDHEYGFQKDTDQLIK